MTRILIKLDEAPKAVEPQITDENEAVIAKIIDVAKKAKAASDAKKSAKTASIRETEAAVEALLEAPNGLSKAELLAASDCVNISSIVIRIRNRIKSDKIFTLEKKGKGDSTVYFLKKT